MNTTSAMMASTIRIVTSENVTVNARSTGRIIDQYAVTGRANPPGRFFRRGEGKYLAVRPSVALGSAPEEPADDPEHGERDNDRGDDDHLRRAGLRNPENEHPS